LAASLNTCALGDAMWQAFCWFKRLHVYVRILWFSRYSCSDSL